jgi:hypothetical protein
MGRNRDVLAVIFSTFIAGGSTAGNSPPLLLIVAFIGSEILAFSRAGQTGPFWKRYWQLLFVTFIIGPALSAHLLTMRIGDCLGRVNLHDCGFQ